MLDSFVQLTLLLCPRSRIVLEPNIPTKPATAIFGKVVFFRATLIAILTLCDWSIRRWP